MPGNALGTKFETGRPISDGAGKFKSPEEELAYLRERVREKEAQLEVPKSRFESDRIARREVAAYAEAPAATILHETVVMPEHDIVHHVLKLEPETHDTQVDGILRLVEQRGIRNALSVVARMKNPHLEDDVHRALVRYIAEGLPDKGQAPPEKVRRALNMVLFEILPQAHGEGDKEVTKQHKLEQLLSSSEQLYAGLTSLIDKHEGFSLEIAVPEGSEEVLLYLAVPRAKKTLAERLVGSVFPNARMSEARGDYNVFNYDGTHLAAYATLADHPSLPIKTPELFEHDPMNLLLAAFAKIAKHGEGAALQITVSTEGDRYNHHYKKILRQLEKGRHFRQAVKIAESEIGEAIQDLAKQMFASEQHKKEIDREFRRSSDQMATEEITRKVKSRIAPVSIRLVASAPTKARARELLGNLQAPFGQYDDPKGNRFVFKQVSSWGMADFLRDFTYREFDRSFSMPLSLAEVTSIFHLTAERVTTSRELKRSFAKQSPAPVETPAEGITIGVNTYGADDTKVRFGPADRLRHAYVIGQTGTGKTGLIKNLIIQDIHAGEGVAFIDPHGNDIEDVLASVPPERAKDVIYFDPAYTARPMGLNMLEYDRSRPEMKTFVVDEVYGIFRKLYADVPEAFGPMFEQYYRNAVQLVVEDPDTGSTFVEIPRVFADPSFRSLKLSHCKNPIIVQFWRKIAEQAQGDPSLENVAPYITSKFDVFLTNDIMRPIVSQEQSAFNFREIMDGKKIFLANLSKGRLGDRNTALLGLILVSKFLQAAFSRVDTLAGQARGDLPVFYLYIDEFQNFATPSIATILSEARKYKLSLTIAHQFIAQLEEDIRDAVIGNVGTKAAFRIGTQDAEFLEKQFSPIFSAQDLENLPNRTAVLSLLVNGVPARPFTIQTVDLPPMDYSRIDEMKELSYRTYGKDREEVEAEIRLKFDAAYGKKQTSPAPGLPNAASLYQ
ncbi:TraM recognition domain-containing protein [Candidatus Kaiserbacteria bacterium]|nr:TraM recognition domain-containing protein [Candidatus Kaiserbacteria bacterium]